MSGTGFQEESEKLLREIDQQKEYYFRYTFPGIVEQVESQQSDGQGNPQHDASASQSGKGAKRKREYLSEEAKQIMLEWIISRIDHPYPTKEEKEELSRRTGLTISQIQYWFINARRRYLRSEDQKDEITGFV